MVVNSAHTMPPIFLSHSHRIRGLVSKKDVGRMLGKKEPSRGGLSLERGRLSYIHRQEQT